MTEPKQDDSCCDPGCCDRLTRREFVQCGGAGLAALSATGSLTAFAGPFDEKDTVDHFVPIDKKLRPEWLRGLFAKGQRTWYNGEDLKTIGMPVGGICAGQVYLTGDGRLVYWGIFNQNINTGFGHQKNYVEGRLPTRTSPLASLSA